MQHAVSEVLTPWAASQILRVVEGVCSPEGTTASSPKIGDNDASSCAAQLEGLLHLANKQPDMASRMMAAPLFSQRPLVETSDGCVPVVSSSFQEVYGMCKHVLSTPAGENSNLEEENSTLPPLSSSALAASGRPEEATFAAEWMERSLSGEIPNLADVLYHLLSCGRRVSPPKPKHFSASCGTATEHSIRSAFRNAAQIPEMAEATGDPVTKVPVDPTPTSSATSAPPPLLRLQLVPLPLTTPQQRKQRGFSSSKSAPLEARCPPSHPIIDGRLLHQFSSGEQHSLFTALTKDPEPFQVYSNDELRKRLERGKYHRRNAMLSAGEGAAPIVAPQGVDGRRGAKLKTQLHRSRASSVSSGWSSHSGSDAGDDAVKCEDAEPEAQIAPTQKPFEDSGEKPEPYPPGAATNGAPLQAAPVRTWVGDDGELVLENGRVRIRKVKQRSAKKPLAELPLPKVVGGPSHITLTAAVPPVQPEPSLSPPTSPTSPVEMQVDGGEEINEKTLLAATRRKGTHGKRPRLAVEAIAANGKKKRKVSGGDEKSTPHVLDTSSVPVLSSEELLKFIAGLRIPETLRQALRIGVTSPQPEGGEENISIKEAPVGD